VRESSRDLSSPFSEQTKSNKFRWSLVPNAKTFEGISCVVKEFPTLEKMERGQTQRMKETFTHSPLHPLKLS